MASIDILYWIIQIRLNNIMIKYYYDYFFEDLKNIYY